VIAAFTCVVVTAGPAWAHIEFEPSEAAPSSVITLELSVADEQADAGTTDVQLVFPDGADVTLAELPDAPGWTTSVEGGSVGSPVTSVTWSRVEAQPNENPSLPIRIGPLPSDTGRLQFQVVQTYSNGVVDRWVEDWPEGAPEPEMPGPVLDVVEGGPGDVVATSTTSATTAPTSTTEATTAPTTATTVAEAGDEEDDSNAALIAALIAAVVVAGGGIGYALWRRRQPKAS
jgi:uncharacterized protein YcnI